ncbi:MAG: cysteine hydrolase family protein [Cyanobacteria bacterium]|nr:cysteine hydrolase family protein [Cyanobacteriota bacterium]MEB3269501.1 cysteine hydrolase family protein [Leptolyngbya sp.]
MDPSKTALLLIGYQNDYFAEDGILHTVIEASSKVTNILANTIHLLEALADSPVLVVSTPIFFTPTYAELSEPVGILKTIKEVGAFQAGKPGSATIPELQPFQSKILEVPGKRGLNAFANTPLADLLREHGITDVVLAGVVTSVCIDSTGRSAHERGFKVTVLSDCTSAREAFEQEFYCENIFPLYARVLSHTEFLEALTVAA